MYSFIHYSFLLSFHEYPLKTYHVTGWWKNMNWRVGQTWVQILVSPLWANYSSLWFSRCVSSLFIPLCLNLPESETGLDDPFSAIATSLASSVPKPYYVECIRSGACLPHQMAKSLISLMFFALSSWHILEIERCALKGTWLYDLTSLMHGFLICKMNVMNTYLVILLWGLNQVCLEKCSVHTKCSQILWLF